MICGLPGACSRHYQRDRDLVGRLRVAAEYTGADDGADTHDSDAGSGPKVAVLPGGGDNRMAFCPDGRTLVTTYSGSATVWDVTSARKVTTVPLVLDTVWDTEISPDCRDLVTVEISGTAGEDGLLVERDLATSQVNTTQKGAGTVAFSRDGRILAAAGESETNEPTMRLDS